MKKLLPICLLSLIVTCSYSQKIQLKKGIISRDGEPIGKMEGNATLLKGTDISILSIEGATVMSITSPRKTFYLYDPIMYYHIQFIPLNKTVSFVPDKFLYSEKNLVEFLFDNIGKDFLTEDGLNAGLVDKFITDKDQSQTIARDTTHFSALVRISREKFNEPVTARPLNSSVQIISRGKKTIQAYGQETLETFDIVQANVLIGKMTKFYKGDPSLHVNTTPPSQEVEYVVLRRVSPFTLDGETIEFLNMAKVKSSLSTPDITAHCERAWAKDLKTSNIYSAEHDIASWLISKGCL